MPDPDPRHPLDALLDELQSIFEADGYAPPPSLVVVSGDPADPSTWEKGLADLDGVHPGLALLGFDAPADAAVVGVVGGGWMAPEDGGSTSPSGHPDAVRVAMHALVGRDGSERSLVRRAGGQPLRPPEPMVGAIADNLRRSLGLPTPPCDDPVDLLITTLWLAEAGHVLREQCARGRAATWGQMARAHPGMRMLAAAGHPPRLDDFPAVVRALDRVVTWRGVRERCEQGWLASIVSPELARWHDDGSLARHVLGDFPPVDVLTDDLCRRLSPAVAARVRAALATRTVVH